MSQIEKEESNSISNNSIYSNIINEINKSNKLTKNKIRLDTCIYYFNEGRRNFYEIEGI